MKNLLIVIAFFFTTMSYASDKDKEHLFVISGVIVNSGASKKIEQFVDMIGKNSGYKLKTIYVDSYLRLSQTLKNNPDALGWTCGSPYVEDHEEYNQQLIAVPLFNKTPTYSSFIVTRKDNNKKSLTEFKDSIFVYSDLRSNSGYIAPSMLLRKNGFNMKNFFKVKIRAGSHERSIDAIYKGFADVAAVDEYIWVGTIKKQPHLANDLHVIQKIGPFPFTPIVAGNSVKKDIIKKIQNSLVNMNKDDLDRFRKDFNLDGFVVKDNSFYEPIKKMLDTLKEK